MCMRHHTLTFPHCCLFTRNSLGYFYMNKWPNDTCWDAKCNRIHTTHGIFLPAIRVAPSKNLWQQFPFVSRTENGIVLCTAAPTACTIRENIIAHLIAMRMYSPVSKTARVRSVMKNGHVFILFYFCIFISFIQFPFAAMEKVWTKISAHMPPPSVPYIISKYHSEICVKRIRNICDVAFVPS